MSDTIKIPGVGPMEKKYVYLGIAGVAGFVGYAYWKNRSAASTDSTATDTTDTSALDQANQDANTSDPYAYDYSGGYYDGSTPIYQAPYYPTPFPTTGSAPTSDPQWVQDGEAYLEGVGVDAQAASQALSRYLANLCLTDQQADYVRQALAGVGAPPQTTHNIQICPPTGNGGSTPPTTAPTGLHVTAVSKTGVTLAWNAVSGAPGYLLNGSGNGIYHSIAKTGTSGSYGGLSPGKKYAFSVRVNTPGGKNSTTVYATTKK